MPFKLAFDLALGGGPSPLGQGGRVHVPRQTSALPGFEQFGPRQPFLPLNHLDIAFYWLRPPLRRETSHASELPGMAVIGGMRAPLSVDATRCDTNLGVARPSTPNVRGAFILRDDFLARLHSI